MWQKNTLLHWHNFYIRETVFFKRINPSIFKHIVINFHMINIYMYIKPRYCNLDNKSVQIDLTNRRIRTFEMIYKLILDEN